MRFTKNVAKKAIATIEDKLNAELKLAGIDEKDLIPGTFYMNGNDGTSFDWKVNDSTCEFSKFYKSTKMGAIKAYVIYRDNQYYIQGYVYKTDKTFSGEKFDSEKTWIDGDLFAGWLQRNLDNKNKYDEIISVD